MMLWLQMFVDAPSTIYQLRYAEGGQMVGDTSANI